jgi:hypothetical protein
MRKIAPRYYLDKNGEFVIENYNLARPFASFFPGIAGKYGIPIWAFYANRAQALCSFGTKDKDNAILEYHPANKAWQLTSTHGFRTFLKIKRGKQSLFYEPFQPDNYVKGIPARNRMCITSAGLRIEEENPSAGVNLAVEYFTIPNENFGALARVVTLINSGHSPCRIQLIDGLPQIVPFGTNNW